MPARSRTEHAHDHAHEQPDVSEVRVRGRRLTRQRQAIWDVLTAQPDAHLSAEQVSDRVRSIMPSLNPSTVYRTLDVLVDDGLVRRTDLGRDRAFYEPAREHLHHHLVCERCDRVTHIHGDALGDVEGRIRAAAGFTLTDREITFFGVCRDCAAPG